VALCIAHRMIAAACNSMGDWARAEMHARQAAALYNPERHGPIAWRYAHDIGVAALAQLSIALWHRGRPEQSADRAREALSLAARLNQHNTQGYAQFYAGVLPAYNRRDFVALGDAAEKLIAIGHKHGMPQWAAWGTCFRGPALAASGRISEAVETINSGVAACDRLRNQAFRPAFFAFLAEAHLAAGYAEQVLGSVANGLGLAERTHERWIVPELWRLKGCAHLLPNQTRSEDAQAADCFGRAVDCARQQGSRVLELRAATSLARLWRDQGRRDEARALLTPVFSGFTEGLGAPDLRDAKELLGGLYE
jgi:predicted ATPase